MTSPRRFPLQWPEHRPRTPAHRRQTGKFTADKRPITTTVAVGRLDAELQRLGGMGPTLSSDVETNLNGTPKSGRRPADPGICLYFTLRGKPFALACDTFNQVEQNIAALAAHLDATRAIARYGVASAEETLQSFSALPPPATGPTTVMAKPWREILGLQPTFPGGVDQVDALSIVEGRFRDRAGKAHPDNGGSDAAMAELNAARSAARKELNR